MEATALIRVRQALLTGLQGLCINRQAALVWWPKLVEQKIGGRALVHRTENSSL